jgi:hypothetical protein
MVITPVCCTCVPLPILCPHSFSLEKMDRGEWRLLGEKPQRTERGDCILREPKDFPHWKSNQEVLNGCEKENLNQRGGGNH